MNDDVRQLIVDLRGGIPEACDFCGEKTAPEELEPEEAGEWLCRTCLARWEAEGSK